MRHKATVSDEESARQFQFVSVQFLRHDAITSLNWWGDAPFPTMLIWASRIFEFQLYVERITGFQPARGLCRRVGYQSGIDGAAWVRKAREASGARVDHLALLLGGPGIIAGAGWGKAELEYDDATGKVTWTFPSGTAIGVSAKAKGEVRNNPACTFMEGYIAGWTNASLGTECEFEEVECVAQGGDHCTFQSLPIPTLKGTPVGHRSPRLRPLP